MPSYIDDAVRAADDLIKRLGGGKPIRAYHGSPYDFDRFDASKIGTGEGAQAYGHGLYFAGNEAVAKEYRDALSADYELPVPHALSEEMNQIWREYNDITNKHSEWARANSSSSPQGNPFGEARDMASRSLMDVKARVHAATQHPGRMYEVEIGHPEESLLNWDRPTSPIGGVGARAAEVLRSVSPRSVSLSDLDYIRSVRPGQYVPPSSGSPIRGVEDAIRSMARDPQGVSELQKAGIPGLKYLDGISRQSGSGTRNYVVFPGSEDAIRILRKYGWLIPAAIASGESQDGDRREAVSQ